MDLPQLQELFDATAFWAQNRDLADLRTAVDHSSPVVCAWRKGQMIGFSRATSDRVFRATIWDVVVHPNYQGLGLGKQLVSRILTHPYVRCVERVYLMTSHQQRFYERLGFEANPTTTMVSSRVPLVDDVPPADIAVEWVLQVDEAGAA